MLYAVERNITVLSCFRAEEAFYAGKSDFRV